MTHTAARIARTALQGLLIAFVLTIPSVIAFGQTLPSIDQGSQEGLFVNHILVGIGASIIECPAELHPQMADSVSSMTCFTYGYSGDILQRDVDLHSDYNNPIGFSLQSAWSSGEGIYNSAFVLESNNIIVLYAEPIDLGVFGVALP